MPVSRSSDKYEITINFLIGKFLKVTLTTIHFIVFSAKVKNLITWECNVM